MPTISMKLNETTRASLSAAAARCGQTVHAFMVKAIESAIERAHDDDEFVVRALAARAEVAAGGKLFDGRRFAVYLKKKANGESARRPIAEKLGAGRKAGK